MSATGEEETADYLVVEGNEDLGNVNRKTGYFEFPGENTNEPGTRKKFYDGEYIEVSNKDNNMVKKVRDGYGVYDDGVEKYEGNFVNDKYHGTGKIVFASGAIYEGEFCENEFHGHGIYTQPQDIGNYEGEWDHGKWHGTGTYTDSDGVEWKGEFFYGKYESPVEVDFGEIKRREIQLVRSESKVGL